MEMTSLRILHRGMIGVGADIQQFTIRNGTAEFDCLFSVRGTPFTFSMTSKGANPKFFLFDITTGYCLNTYLGDKYDDLLQVVKVDGSSGNHLSTRNFFQGIDASIPHTAHRNRIPNEKAIVDLRKDLVEERDKPFFFYWKYWKREKPGMSDNNLKKTMELLGRDAHAYSLRMNASSCWTANEEKRKAWDGNI